MIDLLKKIMPLVAGAGAFWGFPKLFLVVLPGWQERRWHFNKERFCYFRSSGFLYIEKGVGSHEERVDFEYAIKGFTKKQIQAELVARALMVPDFLGYVRCLAKESRNVRFHEGNVKRYVGKNKYIDLPTKNRADSLWRRCAFSYGVAAVLGMVIYLIWVFRSRFEGYDLVAGVVAICLIIFIFALWVTVELARVAIKTDRLIKLNDLNSVDWPCPTISEPDVESPSSSFGEGM